MARALIVALLLAACGDDEGPSDAFVIRDASEGDASTADASSPTDGGEPDGFVPTDAGGPVCEPFETIAAPPADPPYSGTAFITDDFITPDDPSAFVDLVYMGQADRVMFDRRTASFETYEAHLFDATFGSAKHVEIQVNPEFTREDAETEARRYAVVVGRLPAFLFASLETFWIHRGMEAFGGGNDNLLIHTAMGDSYAAGDHLEEIIVHELAHTSMDGPHASTAEWAMAQAADGVALSTYARDNPMREDVAESLGPYLAVRFRPERTDPETAAIIEATIPNRIRYFDCLGLSMDLLP